MFEIVAGYSVAQLAQKLGLSVRGGAFGPCPVCQKGQRSTSDKRPPITHGRQSWRCWACGARGDGVALLAAVLVGQQPTRGDREAWRRLWVEVEGLLGESTQRSPIRARAPIENAKPLPRPPAAAIAEFWRRAMGPTQDRAVFEWLTRRAIDPLEVGRLNLARALPYEDPLPDWAGCRGMSWRAGWRLILPAFGAGGKMESLRARWVEATKAPAKEVSARAGSGSARRLVYCSRPEILRAGRAGRACRIVITEGGPDYLTLATTAGSDWAVFGVWSGSWGEEFAARIPDRSEVVIWTDDDEAGAEYARKIYNSLSLRDLIVRVKA